MSRPSDTPLDRLRRKIWIRALRIDTMNQAAEDPDGNLEVTTWKGLSMKLLQGYGDAVASGRPQGILGVVRYGNDPRRLRRRIPLDEYLEDLPEQPSIVSRKSSGPAPRGFAKDDEPKEYLEIPVDLVEAGEVLCPGSSHWEHAYLWALSEPVLPRLEELRVAITLLMHRLELCTPSLDEYRTHLPAQVIEDLSTLTPKQQIDRYAASLAPLATLASADSLSLLGALVAESFITDHDTLLDLHRDHFDQGVKNLLAHPLMSDVSDEFRTHVSTRVLGLGWELPAAYHISSLSAPFITLEQWKEITGIEDWIPVYS